ncbi:MAG: YciI family protein [Lysobacteraceae bacterium]
MFARRLFLLTAFVALPAIAETTTPAEGAKPAESTPADYDEALANELGADDYGMRAYVLVILKTGPTRVTDEAKRKEMFAGHFANMKRLAEEGTLALAGPLDGVEGRRGIFIFAVPDIESAKAAVATDPVIQNGEMVAEFHQYYGSAALMKIRELHKRIAKKEI